jgi:hypothetical protein
VKNINATDTSRFLNAALPSLTRSDQLNLLTYLAQNGDTSLLNGLALLPLANGQFTTFQQRTSTVTYWCPPDMLSLFPGLEDKFCDVSDSNAHKILFQVAISGKTLCLNISDSDICFPLMLFPFAVHQDFQWMYCMC